jgi:hypothetical protein
MTAQGPSPQEIAQMWEAGAKSLAEGWRQAQEFWNNPARSWGEMAATWMRQPAPPGPSPAADAMATWRELQEAAFAVAQAWMRLPLLFAGGAQPREFQEAVTQLGLAQGRAYKLWLEALKAAGAAAGGGTSAP